MGLKMETNEKDLDEVCKALQKVSDRIVDQLKEYYKPKHALVICVGSLVQVAVASNMKKEMFKECVDRAYLSYCEIIDVVHAEMEKLEKEGKK
jgi:hypothetical protein